MTIPYSLDGCMCLAGYKGGAENTQNAVSGFNRLLSSGHKQSERGPVSVSDSANPLFYCLLYHNTSESFRCKCQNVVSSCCLIVLFYDVSRIFSFLAGGQIYTASHLCGFHMHSYQQTKVDFSFFLPILCALFVEYYTQVRRRTAAPMFCVTVDRSRWCAQLAHSQCHDIEE